LRVLNVSDQIPVSFPHRRLGRPCDCISGRQRSNLNDC
jgi:hypothetical protein